MTFKHVHVTFIIPENCEDETQTSSAMQDAYSACKQNFMNVRWVRESDGECIDMQKTDFLIFQEFSGGVYEKAMSTKSVILGPWCLLICLSEVKPIPNVDWPLMNMAMDNCVVACSNIQKQYKQDIRFKVQAMGGHFTTSLTSSNTHLVSDSVRSEKYNKAAPIGLKIMLPSWVDEVWKANLEEMVHADDDRFTKHKCPPFHKLTICTTGFTIPEEISKLQRLITENGGNYSKQLVLKNTDILICNGSSSEKYKAARRHKIDCVSIDWILDSVSKGYLIPDFIKYPVKKGTSTPTKGGDQIDPNFSMMSAIGGTTLSGRSIFQDSTAGGAQCANPIPPIAANKRKSPIKYDNLIDGIDMKRVKRAESFLDGCSVYLAGFTSEHHDKLCKVLNFSGAIRLNTLSERITHIIVGDSTCHEVKLIRTKNIQCPMVSVKWVVDSIEKRQPVSEEEYLISAVSSPSGDHGSPLITKGVRLLKTDVSILESDSTPKAPEVKVITPPEMEEPNQDNDIMMQYMRTPSANQEDSLAAVLAINKFDTKQNITTNKTEQSVKPPDCSSPSITISLEESRIDNLLRNKYFRVLYFPPEEENKTKSLVEEMGGRVLSNKSPISADYAIVPIDMDEITHYARHFVTDIWLKDVYERKAFIKDYKYYHQPCFVDICTVMNGCVIALSGFSVAEKAFLKVVCERMGAVVQDALARIAKEPNILASTHLVSAEDSGKKYEGAIKWGLPVVSKDWVLACSNFGKFIKENDYLIGCSKKKLIHTNTDENELQSKFKNSIFLNVPVNKEIDTPTKRSIPSTSKSPDITQDENQPDENLNVATPLHQRILGKEAGSEYNTPPNNESDAYGPITPVSEILRRAGFDMDVKTPKTPKIPKPWDNIATPTSPLGAAVCDGTPPPELRKKFAFWISGFPDNKPRKGSTPLSEIKRRFWNRVCPELSEPSQDGVTIEKLDFGADDSPMEPCAPVEIDVGNTSGQNEEDLDDNVFLEEKLTLLDSMLKASASSKRSTVKRVNSIPAEPYTYNKVSQPFSVGWDEDMDSNEPIKNPGLFMISGVDAEEREQLVESLEKLGAKVSDLQNYDPASTHLLCQKLNRNEKLLASMAAGKWVLHISYVEDSLAAGKFLDEEDYEFGNPKSSERIKVDKESEKRAQCVHSWRKDISRRGYGAFHDVRCIVVANKREPMIRVIEAGGGMVIDASPPFEDNIFATHCFLEVKKVSNFKDYIPLAQQGIYCLNTLYVNEFLHKEVNDYRDFIVPSFQKYYS